MKRHSRRLTRKRARRRRESLSEFSMMDCLQWVSPKIKGVRSYNLLFLPASSLWVSLVARCSHSAHHILNSSGKSLLSNVYNPLLKGAEFWHRTGSVGGLEGRRRASRAICFIETPAESCPLRRMDRSRSRIACGRLLDSHGRVSFRQAWAEACQRVGVLGGSLTIFVEPQSETSCALEYPSG